MKHRADDTVYAVMITGKDAHHELLARNAVESFLRQTFPRRTLVIVNDGPYSLADLVSERVTEVRVRRGKPLGELRNIALSHVPAGSVWTQWDDDDWCHQGRIEIQYRALRAYGASVCFLSSQTQYAFALESAWEARYLLHDGTVMMVKDDTSYPPRPDGEDTRFRQRLLEKGVPTITLANRPFLYLRLIHGNNTVDDEHFELSRRTPNRYELDPTTGRYLRSILQTYYRPLLRVPGPADSFVSDSASGDTELMVRAVARVFLVERSRPNGRVDYSPLPLLNGLLPSRARAGSEQETV